MKTRSQPPPPHPFGEGVLARRCPKCFEVFTPQPVWYCAFTTLKGWHIRNADDNSMPIHLMHTCHGAKIPLDRMVAVTRENMTTKDLLQILEAQAEKNDATYDGVVPS